MDKYVIVLNIIGSLLAVLISTTAILFAWKKLIKKLFSLRTAGGVCGVYLLAAVLVLPVCFLLAGKMPAFCLSDVSLLLTIMTISLTAVWLSVTAAVCCACWQNMHVFSADIVILLILMLLVLCLFFGRLSDSWGLLETAGREEHLPVLILAFLATNGVVFLMVNQAQNEAAEKEMAEARHQAELERIHFERVEECRQELDGIRSDYDALLVQAHELIENHQTDQAKKLLNGLSERIDSTKEAPFCRIAVVNAILEMKKKECDREHIARDVEMALPGGLPVKDLDLCMALGNLLDNAIRECKKAYDTSAESGAKKMPAEQAVQKTSAESDAQKMPRILLAGRVVQDYLVLRCVNPVYFGEKQKPEGTGYGLKILQDMAQRYQGDFFIKRESGSFTSQLSLSVFSAGERA